jgi:hypothetical protein
MGHHRHRLEVAILDRRAGSPVTICYSYAFGYKIS